jgi:hypothetical protein
MSAAITPCEERLVALLAAAVRGPERDGLFAVWLIVRAAEGVLPPAPISARNHRRRLQATATRVATLALPKPLERALVAARQHLEPGTAAAAAVALSLLVAPVREVLGSAAGEAVAVAAKAARIH